MKTIGRAQIPERLKQQILSRRQLGGENPRAKPGYRLPASVIGTTCSKNNFCNGMFSAVNWEQVARMQQQVYAARNARVSLGPKAGRNSYTGRPQYACETFCPYLSRSALAIAPQSGARWLLANCCSSFSAWTGPMFSNMPMTRTDRDVTIQVSSMNTLFEIVELTQMYQKKAVRMFYVWP